MPETLLVSELDNLRQKLLAALAASAFTRDQTFYAEAAAEALNSLAAAIERAGANFVDLTHEA